MFADHGYGHNIHCGQGHARGIIRTREWLRQQSFAAGCAATFGGDEVIIAAAIGSPATFLRTVADLRDRLAAALPCAV